MASRAQPEPANVTKAQAEKKAREEGLGALSTSTSSFEALDPHDPQLNHLASLMFSKTSDWISAELDLTSEDYKLLEQMNR